MKLSSFFMTVSFAVAGFAQAAPVIPKDFSSGLNTEYSLTGTSSTDGNVDWFVFDANGISLTSFYFDRTMAAPDLIAGLYRGDTTGFDYTASGAQYWYSDSSAATYNPALTFIQYWDDTHDDSYGGPWGDPNFSIYLSAGRYSLALSSLQNGGTYQFTTNETSVGNAVPEPTTITLFGLGLLGFVASNRKSAKNKTA